MNENHISFMKKTLILAKKAALESKTGGPFGALIVKDNKIIAEGTNQVVKTKDPTWHAEMEAIRNASQVLGHFKLLGCSLYTSSEPCPMCLSACYWAGIEKIYYAASVEDALQFGDFDDSFIYTELQKKGEERKVPMYQLLRAEALPIFEAYANLKDRTPY
jgi:tRNA(Arg) A34 adenosine deaminase TadA